MIGWDEQVDLTQPPEAKAARRRPALTPAVVVLAAALVTVGGLGIVRHGGGTARSHVADVRISSNGPARRLLAAPDGQTGQPGVAAQAFGSASVAPALHSIAESPLPTVLTAVAEGASLRLSDGRLVQLLGIDAGALPPGQDCRAGTLAATLEREVPAGTPVTLEGDPADPSGQYVRRAADGQLLNALLLAQGAAPAAPGELRLRDLLSNVAGEAVTSGRGVWAPCPSASSPAIGLS